VTGRNIFPQIARQFLIKFSAFLGGLFNLFARLFGTQFSNAFMNFDDIVRQCLLGNKKRGSVCMGIVYKWFRVFLCGSFG